ncbi:hypothetical protein BV361_03672 [Pseudomonas syringae pv. actinidiae]|nr:hypothetical protein BV361_03672 [Pseudomonas syringae pv. actinidiae]
MNELKDEQGRREDSAIDYGWVDAVWGDDMFTGINDTNIPRAQRRDGFTTPGEQLSASIYMSIRLLQQRAGCLLR